jgi:hypothetical protein
MRAVLECQAIQCTVRIPREVIGMFRTLMEVDPTIANPGDLSSALAAGINQARSFNLNILKNSTVLMSTKPGLRIQLVIGCGDRFSGWIARRYPNEF